MLKMPNWLSSESTAFADKMREERRIRRIKEESEKRAILVKDRQECIVKHLEARKAEKLEMGKAKWMAQSYRQKAIKVVKPIKIPKPKLSPEEIKRRFLIYYKKWRKKNPDKIKGYAKNFYINNPGYYKAKYRRNREVILSKKYGLTPDQVKALKLEQNYKCKMCGKDLVLGHSTHIDHDHITNKVRGILCNKCNLGLGFFNDNIKTLKLGIKYLRAHS
jgi:DNA-directed RNA polymerase subunit RPC12/RpoP